jgi:uncharacterized integral membrane protein
MIKFFIYLSLLIIFLIFGFNNSQTIDFTIIPNKIILTLPLYLLIFLVFLLGFFMSFLAYRFQIIKLNFSAKKNRKKISNLEEQIKEYHGNKKDNQEEKKPQSKSVTNNIKKLLRITK